MEFTARQIATFLNGEVVGDLEAKVNNVAKIENGKPGDLSFLANPKYNEYVYKTRSSIVLVNRDFKATEKINSTLVKVEDAYQAIAQLMDLYVQSLPRKTGTEVSSYVAQNAKVGLGGYRGAFSYIDENCEIGNNVEIHPHCWIARGSKIGDNTILFSGVKVYPETIIGKNCIVHAGAVIGSDGFGFAKQNDGSYKKLHQIGNVIIEDDVEIGANSVIDCATMGSTILRKGVKLDNMVQIAHNVEVGENTVFAAQSGISGSTVIGRNCIFGGHSGAAGHLKIGDNVTFAGKAAASKDIADGSVIMGEWGMDASRFRRAYAIFRNLPEIYSDLNKIKKDLKQIKAD